MSGRTVPVDLLAAQPLGARLAQLGQGRDLEHPVGDVGLEAGQQPAGERVAARRASTSVKISVSRQSSMSGSSTMVTGPR